MAKKKILRLTDEQYYKYIMSLKNGYETEDTDGNNTVSDSPEKPENEKNK